MPMMLIYGRKHTYYKRKKEEDLIVASKDIGLEVNADKTKYMFMSRDQNAGRSPNTKINNRSLETAKDFKYLRTTFRIQNSIQEEIQSSLKSENACYHWCRIVCLPVCFQNILILIYTEI
jgi:hypothetical protein